MSILKSLKKDLKTLGFKLPSDLVTEYKTVQEKAKVFGLAYDLTEQIERLVAASNKAAAMEVQELDANKTLAAIK